MRDLEQEIHNLNKSFSEDHLIDIIKNTNIQNTPDLKKFFLFSEENYKRNLIFRGTQFEILVLCWLKGQESPIHDHRGSNCIFKIIEGTLKEKSFIFSEKIKKEYTLNEGDICKSFDSDVHKIINYGENKLITLHAYYPPLKDYNIYDETGNII